MHVAYTFAARASKNRGCFVASIFFGKSFEKFFFYVNQLRDFNLIYLPTDLCNQVYRVRVFSIFAAIDLCLRLHHSLFRLDAYVDRTLFYDAPVPNLSC